MTVPSSSFVLPETLTLTLRVGCDLCLSLCSLLWQGDGDGDRAESLQEREVWGARSDPELLRSGGGKSVSPVEAAAGIGGSTTAASLEKSRVVAGPRAWTSSVEGQNPRAQETGSWGVLGRPDCRSRPACLSPPASPGGWWTCCAGPGPWEAGTVLSDVEKGWRGSVTENSVGVWVWRVCRFSGWYTPSVSTVCVVSVGRSSLRMSTLGVGLLMIC